MNLKRMISKNSRLRELIRFATTSITREQLNHNPIIMFSHPRSGSTWLMELLAAQKGVEFINEPLGPKWKFFKEGCREGIIRGRHFVLGDSLTGQKVVDYLESKAVKNCGPYNPFSKTYNIYYNRRLYKILNHGIVYKYISDHFSDCPQIYFVRHPCSTLLSSRVLVCCAEDAINSLRDNRIISDRQFREGVAYLEKNDPMEMRMLEWACRVKVIADDMQKDSFGLRVLTYEEVVLNPRKSVELVADYCELGDVDEICKNVHIPSASTTQQAMDTLTEENRSKKISAWRSKLSQENIDKFFALLDLFEIDLYERDSDYINPKYDKFYLSTGK